MEKAVAFLWLMSAAMELSSRLARAILTVLAQTGQAADVIAPAGPPEVEFEIHEQWAKLQAMAEKAGLGGSDLAQGGSG